jgi:hypothetical protein
VEEEMQEGRMHLYTHFGEDYNDIIWRTQKPLLVYQIIDAMVFGMIRRLDG